MAMKSQSAMEYLMTYGWAILIIAIVMVAMFQLGIFNTSNPRVSAGACEVYRSAATSPTLTGECQGVWPQFVAQFNGGSSKINIGAGFPIGSTVTISVWINSPVLSGGQQPVLSNRQGTGRVYFGTISSNIFIFDNGGTPGGVTSSGGLINNMWFNIVWTSNGVTSNFYVNGVPKGTPSQTRSSSLGTTYIGWDPGGTNNYWDGSVSNVQIYNTSFSQAEVTALYQEGIGGAPIDPTNIVGWWPLNGNAQDYSGNGNNGQATGVTYTSAWTSGYTQP